MGKDEDPIGIELQNRIDSSSYKDKITQNQIEKGNVCYIKLYCNFILYNMYR